MPKAYRMKEDRVVQGEVWARTGAIVYPIRGWDYGLASDDTRHSGVEHKSVTFKADGDYPSFTVPARMLEPLSD
ncbi:hypothetical protein [Methylocystis hirsuta]|uniref:Uncharacterized protein n=1 Tax=Methylocystis hirsuta TaxID=369798 RepID=A0A3M9XNT2_9HYPH|nr:hypothetical protein [Methylocystis hirsuta]RNJ49412.1 hypothetical protein D1O30_07140 [Methylocystis hirsuta]